jgi:hypothetical protein
MRKVGILACFVVCALGASVTACRRTDRSEITRVAEQFFAAAATGDSTALLKTSIGQQPLRFWAYHRANRQLLSAAAANLELDTARRISGSNNILALFTFVSRTETYSVSAEFTEVHGVCLIKRIYLQ